MRELPPPPPDPKAAKKAPPKKAPPPKKGGKGVKGGGEEPKPIVSIVGSLKAVMASQAVRNDWLAKPMYKARHRLNKCKCTKRLHVPLQYPCSLTKLKGPKYCRCSRQSLLVGGPHVVDHPAVEAEIEILLKY